MGKVHTISESSAEGFRPQKGWDYLGRGGFESFGAHVIKFQMRRGRVWFSGVSTTSTQMFKHSKAG